jgi:Lrp/AsnC family transcriptional regulator, leucine-responsive regulatory protein
MDGRKSSGIRRFSRYSRGVADGNASASPRLDDAVDARIVREVSLNARATLAELSASVGLSVSAVQARLRRLETRGVITGYRAVVDPEAAGKPLAAFIEITPLDPAQPDTAPEQLEHLPEIEACHSIAGDASYLLYVRVASPRDLERLIRDIRAAASVNTRTTVVLQTFFENRPLLP